MRVVDDWSAVGFIPGTPNVFPEDYPIIQASGIPFSNFNSEEEFDASDLNRNKINHLHLGLLPNPYGGNIESAEVIILTLNPGFTPSEYTFERTNVNFRQAIIRAVHQTNGSDEFPFCALNPDFYQHPGFVYWAERRFDTPQHAGNKFLHLARQIVRTNFYDIDNINEAFMYLSKRVTCLEYLCYHSKSFDNEIKDLALRLPSSKRIVEGLHDELIPQAKKSERLIICMRGPRLWKIQNIKHSKIVIYPPELRQSASLTLHSPGGIAIQNFLGIP